MKYLIYGILSAILFASLTGCTTYQPRRYYVEVKSTTLHCPVGSVYRLDGWCHYPNPGYVDNPLYIPKANKKSKKRVQPKVKITCKEVYKVINQCSRGN